ncbi:MAG: glycine--tRNA ligase subunit beta [Gammaproteobacteria bacterium]|nr:glycine--tRNA ligase subunit beta [Gammaproteobacteria bacterium]
MTGKAHFLIEIGTEELPPKALYDLAHAFKLGLQAGLAVERLAHEDVSMFATPRRLAVLVKCLDLQQADEDIERRGPPLERAFDAEGKPSIAATKFAESNGVSVIDLQQTKTEKGTYLMYRGTQPGVEATTLLPGIVQSALDQLPIPKRMRWGDRDVSFVRPVHWLVMLLGDRVIPCELYGLSASNISYGHRFMAPQDITIPQAEAYPNLLLHAGEVQVDYAARRKSIEEQVLASAEELNGQAVIDKDLLDEVTSLVEMPFPVVGDFDQRFLELPEEVLIETLQQHQKYFPVRNSEGKLLPNFITISNIKSKDAAVVKHGNERVIRPRLADAEFFYRSDLKTPLEQRIEQLDKVIFQKDLGSLGDKVKRVSALSKFIAKALGDKSGIELQHLSRAASLCKCDLLTDMVGEFPELQGVMGRYYALAQNEHAEVANALDEHYQPRFSGDRIPAGIYGQVLSIADKLDTIVGIFSIGKKPSGTRDPFSLRRQALGLLRIMNEAEHDLDLRDLILFAIKQLPEQFIDLTLIDEIFQYLQERARGYFLEQGFSQDQISAVFASSANSPLDMRHRLHALQSFTKLPAAPNLAAAHKRVSNILKKNATQIQKLPPIKVNKISEKAEYALHQSLAPLQTEIDGLLNAKRYTDVLLRLARLREPIDNFFDQVMVMSEDQTQRENRLNLLKDFHRFSSGVADLAQLELSGAD